EDAADEIEGARQRRHRQPRSAAGAIDHRHRQPRLQLDVAGGADVAEERECLDVAADENVLAVVDQLAGVAVGERGGAPAEAGLRLEHQHVRAVFRQAGGCAQAGEAAADDDDVEGRSSQVSSHCLNAMIAWRGRGTRARAVNTSWPLRSIRRSVSKYTALMISAATSRRRSSAGSASFAR